MSLAHLTDLPEMPENLRLLCPIGNGAAGNCFLVADSVGTQLALKVVSAEWREREVESLRAFRKIPAHFALTQIFGCGNLPDGRFYYTMELADNAGSDGRYRADTLAFRLKNRSIPLAELLGIVSAAASGAEHLHKYGSFHGDIKPENIIFVNGCPKLADFGTLSANVSGTAGFVPENPVSGIDRDCYALGKTFYCAWSGLDAAAFPALPESFDPKELRSVRKIYLRACHSAAPRRFATAGDLITALQKAGVSSRTAFPWKRLLAIGAFALFFLTAAYVLPLLVPVTVFLRMPDKSPGEGGGRRAVPFSVFPRMPDKATLEARWRRQAAINGRRWAEEWMREHPQVMKMARECGLTFTFDPESGDLEVMDTEYGIRCGDYSWLDNCERYVKIKRWMREHPDEVTQIRECGINFTPDPEFGMQLHDSRNGYRAVGDLESLLDYWKNGHSKWGGPRTFPSGGFQKKRRTEKEMPPAPCT